MKVEAGQRAIKGIRWKDGEILSIERREQPVVTNLNGDEIGDVPPRVEVRAELHPAEGSDIKVEVWLPDKAIWNGRFLGLGNGGKAGGINLSRFVAPLRAGYAVATTDMGTAQTGVGNVEVWRDFGYRATHLMTVAGKEVTQAYYGEAPRYAYFNGRSTGGQQGLQEAQRYPEDYDGIVAEVPAHCRAPLHAYFLWNEQILSRCAFSETQQAGIEAAGIDHMAGRQVPALAGRAIADPRAGSGEVEAVIRLARERDRTLTDAHEEALRELFGGPRHAVTGERIFGGIPIGSPFRIAGGNLYLFQWVFGEDVDLMGIDFGRDIDRYMEALGGVLNAENPDLRAYEGRGGKMIVCSGAADSCVPFHATLDYYERVAERMGGIEKASAFFKYYIIPGMEHGRGPVLNALPDLLEAVVQWREKGIAPGGLRAERVVDGVSEISVPIPPYPLQVAWNAEAQGYEAVEGPRGNVERVAERFRAERSARQDEAAEK